MGGVAIVEVFDQTNLVAVAGGGQLGTNVPLTGMVMSTCLLSGSHADPC